VWGVGSGMGAGQQSRRSAGAQAREYPEGSSLLAAHFLHVTVFISCHEHTTEGSEGSAYAQGAEEGGILTL
jgi:hypothetical protein